MRTLLTGGAGFVGAHCVEHFMRATDDEVIVLDGIGYAGDPQRLAEVLRPHPEWLDRVRIFWHDLRAPILGHDLDDRIGHVDRVIHMAADSHVERSLLDPGPFIHNNVMGTVNVMDFCRAREVEKVIQISTDEVYGPAVGDYHHVEWDVIAPSNPYAASKACQEAVAFSYWRSYGVPVAITNTMNNYGERQHREKFVPMAVRKVLLGEPIPVHGVPTPDGWVAASRVWLHARNHADALRFLLDEVDFPAHTPGSADRCLRVNVAGDREIGVDEVVRMIGRAVGKEPHLEWVDYHSSRPGHDLRYSLDDSLLAHMGWKAPMTVEDSFAKTVRWYVDHPHWLGL